MHFYTAVPVLPWIPLNPLNYFARPLTKNSPINNLHLALYHSYCWLWLLPSLLPGRHHFSPYSEPAGCATNSP